MKAARAVLPLLVLATGVRSDEIPLENRRSSYDTMAPETRAMQDDDSANPGMFWVLDGETLWSQKAGETKKSCADCHGDARTGMKDVAARHPAFDPTREKVVDIEDRVNICRGERQNATPFPRESKELLALAAFIARQSKGAPIVVADDDRTRREIEIGRGIWNRRQGQLNLSCANCHDDNWGRKLAGATLPQAHPTGYPVYRLEWQTMGSLQRRLRNCLTGMRAQSWAYGSEEFAALGLFLAWRARGMPMDAPGVRP